MYSLEKAKNEIAKKINQTLKKKLVKASDLVTPGSADFGDLSLSCFALGKALGKTPVEAAAFLVGKIKWQGMIAGAKAIGPYLNLTLNKQVIFNKIIGEIKKDKTNYGRSNFGQAKKVMIEYSNANTHKEYHIGHLRNICLGDSVNRILDINGYKVLPVSYINDFGIHVAKTLWWTYHKDNQEAVTFLKKAHENRGYFLGRMYAAAVKKTEESPASKSEVYEVMKQIENRRGEMFKMWQKTRQWSIDYFGVIYKELGVNFSHIFYESEYIDAGKELVARFYAKRILEKSQGAIIANLEKYNLGVLVIIRSDGTALYPVADLPLAIAKFKKYKIDQSIYVVDIRQSLYFKQLFKLLELIGIKKETTHLAYDFVKLPSGMMSSRSGNVITYQDLRRELMVKTMKETKKRHADWPDKKIETVAASLTNGAIKFEMIKVSSNQVITFDINQALQFDGFTAAYLQYTGARINSIIKKAQLNSDILQSVNRPSADENSDAYEKEYNLVMKLARYPETTIKAGVDYDPSVIAKYLFDLGRDFNDYYHSVPVLKAEAKTRLARLELVVAVRQVITNGLDLLGIEAPEEM